jgi:hypothetical protein
MEEPLRCSLENLPSIRNPKDPYTAVSYFWGETKGTVVVDCDGRSLEITRSAYDVLRHLRHKTKTSRVWIDRLCINQEDLAEKETVVKRMPDIYASAREVVIWLGGTRPQDEHFFDDYRRWRESKKISTPFHFISLLGRGWFTRKWIIQEAVRAQPGTLTVMCGPNVVPWDGEYGFARFVLHERTGLYVGDVAESEKIQQAIGTVRFIDENRNTTERPSLFDILLRTRYTDASNVTDYVAAVLGLAGDWNTHCDLSPRYGPPGEENSASVKYREFVNFAEWDIRQNGSIRVLAYASGPKEPGGLPSWVPDWTIKDMPEPLSTYSETNAFCSAPCTGGEWTPIGKVRDTIGHPTLEVQGEVIDIVGPVTPEAPAEFSKSRVRTNYDEKARNEVGLWLQKCLDVGTRSRGSFQGAGDFEQFAKAISFRFNIGDSFTVQHFRHPQHHAEFVADYLRQMTGQQLSDLATTDGRRSFLDTREGGPFPPEVVIAHVEEPLRRWAVKRRFCRTEKGRMGFVPAKATTGDKICLIRGHCAPYVLRKQGSRYLAVGECYIEGVMDVMPENVRKPGKDKFILT